MNLCFLYYYWNDNNSPDKDMQYPIITSIASLRMHNKEIPIYVIDTSHKNHDWTLLEHKYKFHTLKKISEFEKERYSTKFNGSIRMLSRPAEFKWFSNQVNYDKILFCDSDIIWIKNPLPLKYNNKYISFYEIFYKHRNIRACNTGLIYWNSNSTESQEALHLWYLTCKKAISDMNICKNMLKEFNFYSIINDELVMCYLLDKIKFNAIPRCENFLLKEFPYNRNLNCEFKDTKNIHLKADYFPLFKNRGNLCIYIKELKKIFQNLDLFQTQQDHQKEISINDESLFNISDMRFL